MKRLFDANPGGTASDHVDGAGTDVETLGENSGTFLRSTDLSYLGRVKLPGGTMLVLRGAECFQVIGADTSRLSAAVVYCEARRNRTNELLERGTVDSLIAPIQPHLAIERPKTALPYPARRLVAAVHEFVVSLGDERRSPRESNVVSRVYSGLLTAADAKIGHRVASLVEVARKGWRNVFPSALFYSVTSLERRQ
jgi:hypothetical protein